MQQRGLEFRREEVTFLPGINCTRDVLEDIVNLARTRLELLNGDMFMYSFSGINLTQVAVHEIGHSLGLEHTNVRGAIMFPSYEGYRPNLDLAEDDIRGELRVSWLQVG